ncbi:hypothetical protein DICPUDRAFT_154665 [Dictyostelium purpureum]|uniref:lysozyme n=1 Tax=Dictyostelium purpureum TaxID=5786 RepID=F0ZRX8_DICPU|nr:uncharacterized protein DICPUDRAFT_154665 [Dictyostelium purpureum]EGC33318.1 hypothetical protein DICPUDRAFT_154665 [Dictyostelium purpureum]|eukprot:XP_003290174.1 hypothetical protein DICPUDRAFT_154665 [Dictyostelium purpureum]
MKVILLLCILALLKAANAANGVDVSSLVSTSSFKCLNTNGYEFAVVRCFRSTGTVDPNCAASVANALGAGMSKVDVYMFPCYSCGNGGIQASKLVSYLKENSVKYGKIWIDIEGPGVYWGPSTSDNAAFFQDMANSLEKEGVDFGVFTSPSQWVPIMGSFEGGSKFPLWYAHYDGVRSFSDFSPFAGWSKPTMKQYYGEGTLCNAGVGKNWYP